MAVFRNRWEMAGLRMIALENGWDMVGYRDPFNLDRISGRFGLANGWNTVGSLLANGLLANGKVRWAFFTVGESRPTIT